MLGTFIVDFRGKCEKIQIAGCHTSLLQDVNVCGLLCSKRPVASDAEDVPKSVS